MAPALRLVVGQAGPLATAVEARGPERVWVSAVAAVCGLLLLGSIAAALVTGRPWELRSSPTLHRTPR